MGDTPLTTVIVTAALALLVRPAAAADPVVLTIASVNNPDMIVMQQLAPRFEAAHPDIRLHWVVLEENVLRQRVTTDIATHSGAFDLITTGIYEVPIWGRLGWLAPFTALPQSYQVDDLLPSLRNGLTVDGHLAALPFYGESTFTLYRTDLFQRAGLVMPPEPTWDQIAAFAKKINDPAHGVAGICLRGKPGWGENMGVVGDMANSFGGRYFDTHWVPQFTSPPWHQAVGFYADLLKTAGPPGVVANGYNESLVSFSIGRCGIWVDATVAASVLEDPHQSKVAGKVGFVQAPYATTTKGSHYLWSWTLAVPKTSHHVEAAQAFAEWATSPEYIRLVAQTHGWGAVPPGTRSSTYRNPDYLKAAPYAGEVLRAMNSADPNHPTLQPVPYTGISYVSIPEWQGIGTVAGQDVAAVLSGQMNVDQAMERAQQATVRTMKQAGYPK